VFHILDIIKENVWKILLFLTAEAVLETSGQEAIATISNHRICVGNWKIKILSDLSFTFEF
jgi:hypothetical protein